MVKWVSVAMPSIPMRSMSVALALSACGAPRPAPVAPSGIRVQQIIGRAELIGHIVSVDIYEPMYNRDTGEHEVDTQGELVVVAAKDDEERAAGALSKLPETIDPPVQIRGMVKRDGDRWRLVAHDIKPLATPKPERVASAAALIADPKWNGRFVVVEGKWHVGFESSWLDEGVWLDVPRSATMRCAPPEPDRDSAEEEEAARVRVVGLAYSGGQHGHLGAGKARIVATEVVYLGRGCD
jgi:hypothetical protein